MLKELFEGHFYGTFPKIADRVVNLSEHIQTGSFSLLDPKACQGCRFICDSESERREALDKACFFIAGIDEVSLLQAVDTAVTMNQNGDYGIPVPDYIEENVSTKVVKIIQSYVGIVNKMVWRKF